MKLTTKNQIEHDQLILGDKIKMWFDLLTASG